MMTKSQRETCPDLYRRLLLATLRGGESAWWQGEVVRKPYVKGGVTCQKPTHS